MSWREILNAGTLPNTPNIPKNPAPASKAASFRDNRNIGKGYPDENPDLRTYLETLCDEDRADFEAGQITPEELRTFMASMETSLQRRRGERPEHYTQPVTCARCGPVWLWRNAPANVLACPWCANREANLPIPRPTTNQ